MQPDTRRILMGRIHGAFGVRGELKVESFSDPPEALFGYLPWTLRNARGEERTIATARGRAGAKGVIAMIEGVGSREQAEALRGTDVWVPRAALPPPKPGEYYWVDLEGLRVVNTEGVAFGTVSHLFATGANDVLVVQGERERLLPFVTPDVVREVDIDAGCITVEWDADF